MRLPKLGIRHRVLAACILLSLGAVVALAICGMAFRSLLRSRARESCTRIAAILEGVAHDRLTRVAAEAKELASSLEVPEAPSAGGAQADRLKAALHTRCPGRTLYSWALYGPEGRRLAAQCPAGAAGAFARLDLGTPAIVERERERFADALRGHARMVLVPDGDQLYALHYQPVVREGRARAVLQVTGEMAESLFPAPADASGAQVVIRPFMASSESPRLVTLDGEPRMIVHRPLLWDGRQLGCVVAAVPYGAEAQYEQAAVLAIVTVGLVSLLVLALLSFFLTRVAMVPLTRVRHFMSRLQSGSEVERVHDIPQDEAGALLAAYQEVLAQSQEWADRLVEFSRAHQELLAGAVEALVSAIEAKDEYTAGHSQRVADTACAVARALGWETGAVEKLRLGAILHDIGKIGISQAILNKPDTLDPQETEIVRQHPVIGARILSSIPGCEDVVRTVLLHHERYGGNGYPTGAGGAAIPEPALIVAIADVHDALTSRRSYRPPYSSEDAIEILERNRGTMFHPELLDAFLDVVRRQRAAATATPPAAAGAACERPDEALTTATTEAST
jgi:putative nucleotidyltransferase with HDIG domain